MAAKMQGRICIAGYALKCSEPTWPPTRQEGRGSAVFLSSFLSRVTTGAGAPSKTQIRSLLCAFGGTSQFPLAIEPIFDLETDTICTTPFVSSPNSEA